MTLQSDRIPGVLWLSQTLHQVNVLEKTGNPGKAMEIREQLNAELEGIHLQCLWNADTREWALQDSLLYERE